MYEKLRAFSQDIAKSVSIVTANGVVSKVRISSHPSSDETITYEVRPTIYLFPSHSHVSSCRQNQVYKQINLLVIILLSVNISCIAMLFMKFLWLLFKKRWVVDNSNDD